MPESMSHRRREEVRAEAQRILDDPSTEFTSHRALAEATLQLLADLSSTESWLYSFAANTTGVLKGVSAQAAAAIESIPEYEEETERGLSAKGGPL